MSDNPQLEALARTEFGKGAARRTRRAGLVPATIRGRNIEPLYVSLPGHATTLALRHANALFEISVPDAKEPVLALTREVQRHPFRDYIEHVDLQAVVRGERIEVEVPVHIIGEPLTGIAILDTQTLRVLAEATSLPETITVDVDGLTDGSVVRAVDIALPEGSDLVGEGEEIVVSIALPRGEGSDQPGEAGEQTAEAES
jgi:large subunit ribosomal protein L25